MKYAQQPDRLPVLNFDNIINTNLKPNMKKRHGNLFPNNIRCLVVGPSNSGKTNAVFNLLFDRNGLCFSNVYVFSKSLYQPKYKFLETVLADVDGVGYFPYNNNDDIITPEETQTDSIIIFDDVICEKQNNITKYFTMGRHNDIDVFYMSQTYSKIPKQLVRDNANFLLVFRQDDRNLKHIFHDHVAPDMTYDKFKEIASEAWACNKNGFLVIDKERDKCKGRYRLNYDTFVTDLE